MGIRLEDTNSIKNEIISAINNMNKGTVKKVTTYQGKITKIDASSSFTVAITFLEPTKAIIRHYDVTGKICPKYYVDNESVWKLLKQDVVDAMRKDEELERAVKVLQDKGIISCPDVWIKGKYSKSNVRSLLIKVTQNY